MKYINNNLKTVQIRNKNGFSSYVMVHDRILFFRENYPDYTMDTEITYNNGSYVIIKAYIKDKDSIICFTGMGCGNIEDEKSIEKAETVAVGRALAFAGIGIDDSIASADEIVSYNQNSGENKSDKNNTYNSNNNKKNYSQNENMLKLIEKEKGFLYKNKDIIKSQFDGRWNKEEKSWYIPESKKDSLLESFIDSVTIESEEQDSNKDLNSLYKELSEEIDKSDSLAEKAKEYYHKKSEKGKVFRQTVLNFLNKENIEKSDIVELIQRVKLGDDELIDYINSLVL